MPIDDVLTRVKELLVTKLGIPPEGIVPEARLSEDLGVDSVDSVQLTLAVEREFGIEIDQEQMESLKSVQDVVSVVERCEPNPQHAVEASRE
jgi:acyl carrier protein